MALITTNLMPPPWRVRQAAQLADFTSPGTLPSQGTLSAWFDDGMGYEHVHIQRDGSTVTVRIDGGEVTGYGGTIGTSYAALLKNVLTSLYGGFAGTYAELHCADQLVDVHVFGKPDGTAWRPVRVEMPAYEPAPAWTRGGSASASIESARPAGNAFDGLINSNNSWFDSVDTFRPQWLRYVYGSNAVLSRYTVHGYVGTSNGRCPKSWTLEASDNGVDWVVLDTVTNISSQGGLTRELAISEAYSHYQINFTATVANYGVGVFEVQYYLQQEQETYGPLGAHLDFANPADLGEDVCGNDNHWTVTGSQSANRP